MNVVGRGPLWLAVNVDGDEVEPWLERMRSLGESGEGVIDAQEVPSTLFEPELSEEVREVVTGHVNARHFSRTMPVEIGSDTFTAGPEYQVDRNELTKRYTRWIRHQSSGRTVVTGPTKLHLERLLLSEMTGAAVKTFFSEAVEQFARSANPDRPDPEVPNAGFLVRRLWLLLDGAVFGLGPQIGDAPRRDDLLEHLRADDLERLEEVGDEFEPYPWSEAGSHSQRFDPVPSLSELTRLARSKHRD